MFIKNSSSERIIVPFAQNKILVWTKQPMCIENAFIIMGGRKRSERLHVDLYQYKKIYTKGVIRGDKHAFIEIKTSHNPETHRD
jgi:hypothetical protein